MKKLAGRFEITILLLLCLVSCSTPPEEPEAPPPVQVDPSTFPDRVAIVNGTPITRQELIKRAGTAAAIGYQSPRGTLEFYQEILDEMIRTQLLYEESLAQGFGLQPGELDQRITTMRSRFEDESEFQAALDKLGLDEEGMRTALNKDIAVKRYVEETTMESITISEEEARQYYDENLENVFTPDEIRARHILILTSQNSLEAIEAARSQLEQIRREVVSGSNFAELAKKYSQDEFSAGRGGDLGWFGRGKMVAPFEEVAFELKKNQLSQVFQTPFGLHLMEVTDKRKAKAFTFEESKESILDYLKEREIAQRLGQKAEELRRKAQIEVFI